MCSRPARISSSDPGGAFVDEHDLADGQALGLAAAQQLGGRAERQRQLLLGLIEFLQRRVLLAFTDDEAAAHREERGTVQDLPVGVGDRERHAVGVPRQDGQRPQHHVLHPVRELHGPRQLQFPGLGDGSQPLLHLIGQDLLRVEALQAQQDGRHRAVAVPRRGERTVKVHPQRRHLGPASPEPLSSSANTAAARIGPTVCELDGPIPMEKRSKTPTAIAIPY